MISELCDKCLESDWDFEFIEDIEKKTCRLCGFETEKQRLEQFPQCKKCYSKRPLKADCLNEEKNTWRQTCLDCGFTETKDHAMAVYEIYSDCVVINGKTYDRETMRPYSYKLLDNYTLF